MRVIEYGSYIFADGAIGVEKRSSSNVPYLSRRFDDPNEVYIFATKYLKMDMLSEEYAYLVCLNTKLDFIGYFELSHGAVDYSILSPREVYQKSLLMNASNIMILHNHPSGDPTPSNADISATKRLVEVGNILGVKLIEHIIIGNNRYYSIDI